MSNKWSSIKKRQKHSARIKRYEIKDSKVAEIAAPAASATVPEEPETLSEEKPETVPSDDESE